MTTITVLMPHVDMAERAPLFEEAKASVFAQTRMPDQFLIANDPAHTGAGVTMNRGLERVTSEWVAELGDDDYFLPQHLAVLEDALEASVAVGNVPDVLYPDCYTLGLFSGQLGGDFDPERLVRGNYIPGGGTLIRTSAIREVGGWCKPGDPDYHRYEDWIMWLRLLMSGKSFLHVPVPTWTYRFHVHSTGGRIGS